MLRLFKFNPQKARLSVESNVSEYGLNIGANPHRDDGVPYGLVAVDGVAYTKLPVDLPVCLINGAGIVIKEKANVDEIAKADYVFSGACMLVGNFQKLSTDLKIPGVTPTFKIPRTGIGILDDGTPIIAHKVCTVDELKDVFIALNAHSAMLLTSGNTLFSEGRTNVTPSNIPAVTLSIEEYQELPRPFIVIDAGHGGSDFGGKTHDTLRYTEKELNLKSALYVYKKLKEKYVCTPFLTRYDDVKMSLQSRTDQANTIDADFFFSIHSNAYDTQASGYESFIYYKASKKSEEVQQILHQFATEYLEPFGFQDRGMKRAGFYVLKYTKCPALLVENLFMDNKNDVEFLNNDSLVEGLNDVYVKGLALAFNLKPKVVQDIDINIEYIVCVGNFKIQANAERLINTLKEQGYTPYLLIKKA